MGVLDSWLALFVFLHMYLCIMCFYVLYDIFVSMYLYLCVICCVFYVFVYLNIYSSMYMLVISFCVCVMLHFYVFVLYLISAGWSLHLRITVCGPFMKTTWFSTASGQCSTEQVHAIRFAFWHHAHASPTIVLARGIVATPNIKWDK